jgi:uncharacterized protein (DUF2141 family)
MKLFTLAAALVLPIAAFAQEGKPGAHFILNWDLDGDGQVTLEELTMKRGDIFYTFDSDNDGFLTVEEYGDFDNARAADMEGQPAHTEGRMGRVQEGMVFSFNDTDGDRQVSRDEFLSRAADWLALIDRDRSGDVTSADFRPRT